MLTGLSAGVTYYFCAIASNSAGTSFGAVLTFRIDAAGADGRDAGRDQRHRDRRDAERLGQPEQHRRDGLVPLRHDDADRVQRFVRNARAGHGRHRPRRGHGGDAVHRRADEPGAEPDLLLLRDRLELGRRGVRQRHVVHDAARRPRRSARCLPEPRPTATRRSAARRIRTAWRARPGSFTARPIPGTCTATFGMRVPAADITLGAVHTDVMIETTLGDLAAGAYYYCAVASHVGRHHLRRRRSVRRRDAAVARRRRARRRRHRFGLARRERRGRQHGARAAPAAPVERLERVRGGTGGTAGAGTGGTAGGGGSGGAGGSGTGGEHQRPRRKRRQRWRQDRRWRDRRRRRRRPESAHRQGLRLRHRVERAGRGRPRGAGDAARARTPSTPPRGIKRAGHRRRGRKHGRARRDRQPHDRRPSRKGGRLAAVGRAARLESVRSAGDVRAAVVGLVVLRRCGRLSSRSLRRPTSGCCPASDRSRCRRSTAPRGDRRCTSDRAEHGSQNPSGWPCAQWL